MPRLVWDRASENSFWFAIEALLVIALAGGMIAVAAQTIPNILDRVRLTEAHFLVTGVRVDLQEGYAVGGAWPATSLSTFTKTDVEGHINDVTFGPSGVVTFAVSSTMTHGRGTQLSYRPARSDTSSSIIWTCGYAEPAPGFTIAGANLTDIDPLALPASCRNHASRN